MAMLYQLSYNGTIVSLPVTYSGTEQVVLEVDKSDSWLRLAISADLEEDLVFTMEMLYQLSYNGTLWKTIMLWNEPSSN